MVVARPKEQKLDSAYTTMWVRDLRAHAQDGDIVLRRGYAVLSDVILLVTVGAPMSHAAIYDGETGTLIDAVSSGVREVPAERFLDAAHRWMIVRPANRTPAQRRAAVARARASIGTGFDFAGFVGIDNPDRFYCSELVAWALDDRDGLFADDLLVTPAELTAVGPTIYASADRGGLPTTEVDPYWR
ncbi:MAG: hypothetical protein IPL61_32115 [Myxococcales bacterium]|nr:hypothetical protein [Myxococcales bacterium]